MATILPNQPVIFSEEIDICSTDTTYYTQIVDNTDVTQFQLGLTVCNGQSQLLPDPTFADPTAYVLGNNWAISGNTLCHTSGFSTGMSSVYQLTDSKYYQLTIVVDSISTGASFNVSLGSTLIGKLTSVGTYVLYGFPVAFFGSSPVVIAPSASTDEICISALSLFEVLTNFKVIVYDDENNFIDLFEYSSAPNYFSFAEDTVTITVDWANFSDDPITNGCYYLCLLDPCLNTGGQNYPPQITNGTFTGSATGWTLASSWTYGSNAVSAVYSATPANNTITQSNVFVNYTSTYSVTVVITAHTGNVSVYFGTDYVGNCTGVGTFVITGVPVGNLDLQLIITSGTATVTSVLATDITAADYVCDYQSNNFKLGDYSCDCPETLLINACNDENGLGFVFNGSGFTPRLRLQGKLKQAKYNAERVVETDSSGTKKIVYYNRRKSKNLVADLLPEYIHDFLSTLVGYDRLYINGATYVVDDDEYNVIYDDSQDNVGSVSLLVSEQTQLIRNVNCSSDEQDCSIAQLDCATGQLGGLYLDLETTGTIDLEYGTPIELE